jgi:hypothetical protein
MGKYKISINGYGAELIIGRVTDEQKEKILNSDEGIEMIVQGWDSIGGYYYEISDIFHNFNVGDSFVIRISDENDNELYSIGSEDIVYNDDSVIQVEYEDKYFEINDPCLVTCSHEKGTFFDCELELEEFDINKLKLVIYEDCGLHDCYVYGNMVGAVFYDGEEIYDEGSWTDGKSFDAKINF